MPPDADAIADCVLSTFDALPDKRKPRVRNDGSREWIPLAGIVLAKDGELVCVSLGTGMKCLPTDKLPLAQGNVLHDWHAEIVALRAFNRFLVDECIALLQPPYTPSRFLIQRDDSQRTQAEFQSFEIRDDVEIHMYCSEAPCGDASMELVMSAQEDATPWTSAPPTIALSRSSNKNDAASPSISALRGRSHFGLLGAVRLKPSRPDAPPTLSKSCTDKIALTQCTSLLSSLTSCIVSPSNAYLTSLIVPQSQYVETACKRAFGRTGRMSKVTTALEGNWTGGYHFNPFAVHPTSREFKYSRRSVGVNEKAIPCNLSATCTPHFQETLIGGVLQGRKQFDPRGASRLCRKSMWKSILEIATILANPGLLSALSQSSYSEVKNSDLMTSRRAVKHDTRREALSGWVQNSADADFGLPG